MKRCIEHFEEIPVLSNTAHLATFTVECYDHFGLGIFLLYILTIWTLGGINNRNINLLADEIYLCSVRLSARDSRLGCRYPGVWWGNVGERDHSENPGVDGRIILRLMFKKWDVGAWTGLV